MKTVTYKCEICHVPTDEKKLMGIKQINPGIDFVRQDRADTHICINCVKIMHECVKTGFIESYFMGN